MTKADTIFKENIERILNEGVFSEQARPKYKDGTVANSKYITGAFAEYDLSKGEDLTLDLANSIAENIEDVDEDIVLSVIETESSDPSYLDSYDFDDCYLYPEVATDRDLGEYLVEELGVELSKEKLLLYLDYEKFGRDVRLEEGGSFVDKGYFVSR